MPTGARGYSDAPRITVNELLKDPLVIPALILDITQNEFIMDSVLRMGGAAPSGAVRYSESTPLYADDFPEIRPEFGEVPVVPTSIGVPRVVFSHERAMAIMVSESGVTQWLGFEADTMIVNHGTKNTLLQSSTFAAPYIGDIASENLLYTGVLPQKIFNLDVLISRQVPAGNAIIMQRHRAGFYADELPFVAGPLYRQESNKVWRRTGV